MTGLTGCARENDHLERKIDDLAAKVAAIDQKIAAGARAPAARPRRPEPAPDTVFAVPVEGLPFRGAADAPVTIVMGYEYACPACSSARGAIADTLASYGDKVRVVYKPYIVHPDVATDASLAACAASHQGKFDTMDNLLWERAFGAHDFSPKNITAIATAAGLDMSRYPDDVTACKAEVKRHEAELAGFGQGATPTFFVNGRYLVGAAPAKLRALVDQELAVAEQRLAGGTARADYYRTWVLDKGSRRFDPTTATGT